MTDGMMDAMVEGLDGSEYGYLMGDWWRTSLT